MRQTVDQSEKLLLDRYAPDDKNCPAPMLFITASPRTGSTPIYQLVIQTFGLYYFSNFVVEHYASHPVVGAALDLAANPRESVGFRSKYGKTKGPFGPSEASWIFKNWFGGDHPSQSRSAQVLPEKEEHMKRSLSAICAMAGRPIVTKNAWNCFRIADLTRVFSDIRFLWFRRDIVRAAVSDLEARYRRGSPRLWNSATTANFAQIQRLPYWEQVVEQQYEYNLGIKSSLSRHCPGRFVQLWYEDMCEEPIGLVEKLEMAFKAWGWKGVNSRGPVPRFAPAANPLDMDGDIKRIRKYVESCPDRFKWCVYAG